MKAFQINIKRDKLTKIRGSEPPESAFFAGAGATLKARATKNAAGSKPLT